MGVIGLILIGLSLWSSIEIKAGELSIKLDQTIDQVASGGGSADTRGHEENAGGSQAG